MDFPDDYFGGAISGHFFDYITILRGWTWDVEGLDR